MKVIIADDEEPARGEIIHLLNDFDDANIYQTWSYGAVRWGEKNLSHVILKKHNEVVAATQLRIVKISWLGVGIAYINKL